MTSYNAGMDAKTSHSAIYKEAIGTLADRLTILMSTSHVVGVNELAPGHLIHLATHLRTDIKHAVCGIHDVVFWHSIPHPKKLIPFSICLEERGGWGVVRGRWEMGGGRCEG